jgi:hypothetical protein
MGVVSVDKLLDSDFLWVEKLPYRDRVPAILSTIERHKTTPVYFAIGLHFAEIDDLARLKYPELTNKSERQKLFLTEFMPRHVVRDRRRLSDYRIAGGAAVKYSSELDQVGVDIFQDEILTKLIELPRAIEQHGYKSEVFKKFAVMKSRVFKKYAAGEIATWPTSNSTIEEYLNEYLRQQSLLSL